MERVEGDFPEAQPRRDRPLTPSEAIAERLAQERITDRTVDDVVQFGRELLEQGYHYDGEVQGYIDFNGRYRPIDFEKVQPLSTNSTERVKQTKNHWDRISSELRDLENLRRPPRKGLPSDLPVPERIAGLGLQRFGTDVIDWRGGVDGANRRIEAIRQNPRAELKRLKANGLTLEMAKAWHVAYKHFSYQVKTKPPMYGPN